MKKVFGNSHGNHDLCVTSLFLLYLPFDEATDTPISWATDYSLTIGERMQSGNVVQVLTMID